MSGDWWGGNGWYRVILVASAASAWDPTYMLLIPGSFVLLDDQGEPRRFDTIQAAVYAARADGATFVEIQTAPWPGLRTAASDQTKYTW